MIISSGQMRCKVNVFNDLRDRGKGGLDLNFLLTCMEVLFFSGIAKLTFLLVGKIEVLNDSFVTCAIITASSSPHNFEIDVRSISSGEVFDGAELISQRTSAGVTGDSAFSLLVAAFGEGSESTTFDDNNPLVVVSARRFHSLVKKLFRLFARTSVLRP